MNALTHNEGLALRAPAADPLQGTVPQVAVAATAATAPAAPARARPWAQGLGLGLLQQRARQVPPGLWLAWTVLARQPHQGVVAAEPAGHHGPQQHHSQHAPGQPQGQWHLPCAL